MLHQELKVGEGTCNASKTSLPAGLLNYNRKNFMFDKAVDQAASPLPSLLSPSVPLSSLSLCRTCLGCT